MEKIYYRIDFISFDSMITLLLAEANKYGRRSLGYVMFDTKQDFEGYLGDDIVYGYFDTENSALVLELKGFSNVVFSNEIEKKFELPAEFLLISQFNNKSVGLLRFREQIFEKVLQDEIEKNFKDMEDFLS